MNHRSTVAAALVIAAFVASPASAQSGQAQKDGCSQAPVEPATPVSKGPASGTDPGTSGSTGWSGSGLGGAFSGTTQAGPVSTSPSFQPVTAKGIDPIKGMPTQPARTC